eukprot:13604320-Alexandrium_andersonii.AAC.1
MSDHLRWGGAEVLVDERTNQAWRAPLRASSNHPFSSPKMQREACQITGPQPTEAQGGRSSLTYKGIGWGQVGLVLSE